MDNTFSFVSCRLIDINKVNINKIFDKVVQYLKCMFYLTLLRLIIMWSLTCIVEYNNIGHRFYKGWQYTFSNVCIILLRFWNICCLIVKCANDCRCSIGRLFIQLNNDQCYVIHFFFSVCRVRPRNQQAVNLWVAITKRVGNTKHKHGFRCICHSDLKKNILEELASGINR